MQGTWIYIIIHQGGGGTTNFHEVKMVFHKKYCALRGLYITGRITTESIKKKREDGLSPFLIEIPLKQRKGDRPLFD